MDGAPQAGFLRERWAICWPSRHFRAHSNADRLAAGAAGFCSDEVNARRRYKQWAATQHALRYNRSAMQRSSTSEAGRSPAKHRPHGAGAARQRRNAVAGSPNFPDKCRVNHRAYAASRVVAGDSGSASSCQQCSAAAGMLPTAPCCLPTAYTLPSTRPPTAPVHLHIRCAAAAPSVLLAGQQWQVRAWGALENAIQEASAAACSWRRPG